MSDLMHDVRYGVRMLLTRPAFTAAAVLSLGLGIGANTTVFSIVNALLFASLPVAEPDRLVAVYTTDEKNPGFQSTSHLNWRDYRAENETFSDVLGYDWAPMSVATGGEASFVIGQLVSGNYFQTLGVDAALGRTFSPAEDETPGAAPVVVVSHHFWTERLGGDRGALGRRLVINEQPFTVIGVTAAEFTGTDVGVQPELWVPMAMNRQIKPNEELNWYEERRGLFVNTVGRLKPGVTLEQARADLATIARRLEQAYPTDNKGRGVELLPLLQATINPGLREGVVAASGVLMTVVGLVLLIACVNVANLLLARATSRRKEIAVRLSIGARRGRLIRQLLTESMLLAVLGAAVGLLIAVWARHALLAFLPTLPFPVTTTLGLEIDGSVLAFTLGLALATGLLFGLAPAIQSTRPGLVATIKDQGDPALDKARRFGFRELLVVVQVALSLVALIGAGLFLRGLGAAQQTDPGFDAESLLVMSFDVALQGLDQPRGEQLFDRMVELAESLPGVASAAIAQAGPLQGTLGRTVFREGQESAEDGRLVQVNAVGPGYFETLGIPVLRGRAFSRADRADTTQVVVVNETMAEQFWPGEEALGKRFRFWGDPYVVEVVGIARDLKYNFLGEDPQPYIYQPLAQRYFSGMTLVTRAAGDPGQLLPLLEREVRALAPGMPLVAVSTVPDLLDGSLWAPRMGASLLGIFGLLALLLAAVGIYGVMSFAVGQRSREIGIRMALGARHGDVLRMVVTRGMLLVGAGLAAGLALALGATRLIAGMIFGVSPSDPLAFGLTLLLLAAVGLLANVVPARRATAVDPILVLKHE